MTERAEYIRKNIRASKKATETSRINKTGLTDRKVKLNSKNFDKLMKQRGLTKQARTELKNSNAQGSQMQVRHAKAGEKFVTTHGTERSSGVFVSEKSLGSAPGERINKGALPHSNTAEFETKVELARDQNIVYGKIAPQSKFSKMDPKQQPRNGGGEQIITDGGYNSGAVRTKDPKYPVPAKQSIMQRANEHKAQHCIKTSAAPRKLNATANTQSKSKGQNRS
ncbi:hypothetical protein [Claveliimonas bilis]|uniref:hypothetical protein n=1 Tax=Claveliimonas bilis TaxID=3028070 RepID=UPI002930D3AD|nr:hypothetical protein [Claveliimonas bilis]BDZ79872.1 hypothetical protein Lac3_10810 [Claveliimonas bilis]